MPGDDHSDETVSQAVNTVDKKYHYKVSLVLPSVALLLNRLST